jgi:predicted metal-dependent phosphoesterase TrpH
VLKVELHAHSADDPIDAIPHTTAQLIDRAAALGYQALAITLHDRQLDVRKYQSFAAERGVTLIPGIERTVQGKHVLLLNFSRASEDVNSFDDLAALKRRESGLVIAPHPFFPGSTCLRGLMNRYADLFDAIEYNAMFTPWLNFNDAAERWARSRGKPMTGSGDIHRLRQLGTTYSFVDAEPDAGAICEAIRAGNVEVEAAPRSLPWAISLMADLTISDVLPAGFWQEAPVPPAPPLTVARRSPR